MPIFPPWNKFIQVTKWTNDCVHFGSAVLCHFINLTMVTTVAAEKTYFKAKKRRKPKIPSWEKKKLIWDGDPVYIWSLEVQRRHYAREIRILFLQMKYLEFSYSKQISCTGYFRCFSEPSPKNLRRKHSYLWYKMMSAFHFDNGTCFIWEIASKRKDQLTFLIFSSFLSLVLRTASWGKQLTCSYPIDKNGRVATQ